MANKKIKTEWEKYYEYLERLRKSGACNMYGSAIFLMSDFNLSMHNSCEIVGNWMDNYEELSKKYNWNN